MSRVNHSNSASGKPASTAKSGASSKVFSLGILATAMLFLPGCGYLQNRQHIEVGSIPDDYRTNHPISLAEQEQHMDVPVGTSDRSVSLAQRQVIQGFVAQYKTNGSGPVQVMLPSGGTNDAAAKRVHADVVAALRKGGVSAGYIITTTYAAQGGTANPVRISYRAITASTDQCGKWPDDLSKDTENKHYADFGCSYQNNLAAMIANPADLLGPRAPGDIDPAKRSKVIADYQKADPSTTVEVNY